MSAHDIPEAYLETPIRFSRLKKMAKSPAHFLAYDDTQTSAMLVGQATHAYLLGQKERVAVYTGGRRDDRIKAWQEFKAEHAGQVILIPSEFETTEQMRRAVERHPRAMELLEGECEKTIHWEIGGRKCKGTPDCVRVFTDRKRVVELKTGQTSSPGLFFWQAKKMFYNAQIDWYSHGVDLSMSYAKVPTEEHFIVAVESAAPFPVTVINCRPSILNAGRRTWRSWWETLINCEASDMFPGYAQGDVDWEDIEGADDELEWDDDADNDGDAVVAAE